jgi:hypothetical protein
MDQFMAQVTDWEIRRSFDQTSRLTPLCPLFIIYRRARCSTG